MSDVCVRLAKESDIANIYDLECEYGFDMYSRDLIESDIKNSQTITLVALVDDCVVAYLSAMVVIDECELLKIIVRQENRHQGIGKKLISFLKKYCGDNDIKIIFLEVREDNCVARTFYESTGFDTIGTRKGYYNGIDAILYKLNVENKSKL